MKPNGRKRKAARYAARHKKEKFVPQQISDEQRRTFLRDEYLFIQGQYEDYDKRSLTIKGWIGSGAIAALAIAFNSTYKFAFVIPLIAFVIVCVVWYLEAYWKLFQYALADRIRIIEAYFRNDSDIFEKNPDPFQIYHYWFKSYSKDQPIYPYEKTRRHAPRPRRHAERLREAAFQRFVYLPYVPLLVLCIGSFFLLYFAPRQ